jgi:DNA-binding CsgD family transcriptional regulator
MTDLWAEIDRAVLDCLSAGHAVPAEIGKRLGISEAAASSVLTMLTAEGKVRICRVALAGSPLESPAD